METREDDHYGDMELQKIQDRFGFVIAACENVDPYIRQVDHAVNVGGIQRHMKAKVLGPATFAEFRTQCEFAECPEKIQVHVDAFFIKLVVE